MIIGLSGKAGCGKGEFAKVAEKEFGAKIVSFAGGLKEEVSEFLTRHEVKFQKRHLYGSFQDKEANLRVRHSLDYSQFFLDYLSAYGDYSNGYWYFTPRTLLQVWGTELRRKEDPEYWVKKAMLKCFDIPLVVIDDVRFLNEVEAIKKSGGLLIRIEREGITISNGGHASEMELDSFQQWDITVFNNGTLEEFRGSAEGILRDSLL